MDLSLCTGCGVCADACPADAIMMMADGQLGFNYPEIDVHKCIECEMCNLLCPIKNTIENKGMHSEAYIAINNNHNVLRTSSSGGVFSALAENIIGIGGFVAGAAYNETLDVVHICTNDPKVVSTMRTSKYVQSNTTGVYSRIKQELNKQAFVLFTGTPCQIAGLYSFLGGDQDQLYTCEVFCHGVPSPGIFKKYVNLLQEKYRCGIKNINYRDKQWGWGLPRMSIELQNGKTVFKSRSSDPYYHWFGTHYSVRESCFNCKYRMLDRKADISIGDFWGIEDIRPDLETTCGVSAVLVNNVKGQRLLMSCRHLLKLEKCKLEDILARNSYLYKTYSKTLKREQFVKDYDLLPFDELVKKYNSGASKAAITDYAKYIKRRIIGKILS